MDKKISELLDRQNMINQISIENLGLIGKMLGVDGVVTDPSKEPSVADSVKNIIMMIKSGNPSAEVPENIKKLPMNLQRIAHRGMNQSSEGFCENLKPYVVGEKGKCHLQADPEKKTVFTLEKSEIEFCTSPSVHVIKAGMELIVRRHRWTEAKVFGSPEFCQLVIQCAAKKITRLKIINPPDPSKKTDADKGQKSNTRRPQGPALGPSKGVKR